jgi:hypothetical protein
MEYQVPQFIDVEDKIFGPFTLKQFIYLAGGAGLCVLVFLTLPLIVAALIAIPVVLFAAALAFYKVNNKPFIEVVEAAVNYFFSKRLYLWRRDDRPNAAPAAPVRAPERPQALPPTQNKLRDLAWSLDVQDRPR